VTGSDDVLLGRAEIEQAFTALGERLAVEASWRMFSSLAGQPWPWPTTQLA
jgi:hypothetical protein